jgi:hypothetical protein
MKVNDKQNEHILDMIIPVQIAMSCEFGLQKRTCKRPLNKNLSFFVLKNKSYWGIERFC